MCGVSEVLEFGYFFTPSNSNVFPNATEVFAKGPIFLASFWLKKAHQATVRQKSCISMAKNLEKFLN